MTDPADVMAPDGESIRDCAERTRAAFPAPFDALAADVRLVVQEWAEEFLLDEMGIEDAYDLTGLYDGVALTERSVDMPDPPSTITLFRRAIIDEWAARGDITLRELVAHVTVHEFAHHFGWSDDDIARIDRWWE